jgi:hypothetical protein
MLGPTIAGHPHVMQATFKLLTFLSLRLVAKVPFAGARTNAHEAFATNR